MKLLKITLVCAALALTACGKKKKSDDKKSGGDTPTAQTKTISSAVNQPIQIKFDDQANKYEVIAPAQSGSVEKLEVKDKSPACKIIVPGKGDITVALIEEGKGLKLEQGSIKIEFIATEKIELADNDKKEQDKMYDALKEAKFVDRPIAQKDKKYKVVESLEVSAVDGSEDELNFSYTAKCSQEIEAKKTEQK